MNRIINDADLVVEDAIRGYLKAHLELVAPTDNPRVIRHHLAPQRGKVGVVTGGGSGHEPAFLGYVGDGMIDAVAIGEIFTSPTAKSFDDAFRAADGGRGVACLYGNYAGDNLNVKLAIKQASGHGLTVKTVVANDDVPSAPKSEPGKRRGVAGEVLMWKVGGARAAEGADLEQVIGAAQKAIDNTRSIGIGLSACTIPAVGKPNFSIEDGRMEVGIGHHGEPGVEVMAMRPARDNGRPDAGPYPARSAVRPRRRPRGADLGLGATPIMELYILYDRISEVLTDKGMKIVQPFVGNYFTSLEMMGVTLTVMRLDGELTRLVRAPARSVGLTMVAS